MKRETVIKSGIALLAYSFACLLFSPLIGRVIAMVNTHPILAAYIMMLIFIGPLVAWTVALIGSELRR